MEYNFNNKWGIISPDNQLYVHSYIGDSLHNFTIKQPNIISIPDITRSLGAYVDFKTDSPTQTYLRYIRNSTMMQKDSEGNALTPYLVNRFNLYIYYLGHSTAYNTLITRLSSSYIDSSGNIHLPLSLFLPKLLSSDANYWHDAGEFYLVLKDSMAESNPHYMKSLLETNFPAEFKGWYDRYLATPKTYNPGDIVYTLGRYYKCLKTCSGQIPYPDCDSEGYWQDLGRDYYNIGILPLRLSYKASKTYTTSSQTFYANYCFFAINAYPQGAAYSYSNGQFSQIASSTDNILAGRCCTGSPVMITIGSGMNSGYVTISVNGSTITSGSYPTQFKLSGFTINPNGSSYGGWLDSNTTY